MDVSKPPSNRVTGIPRPSKVPLPARFSASSNIGSAAKPVPQKSVPYSSSNLSNHEGRSNNASYVQPADHGQATTLPDKERRHVAPPEHSEQASRNRRPRPSLSDRTSETLAQIPNTPQSSRRRSSFFTAQSPMTSPVRPSSAAHVRLSATGQDHVPSMPSMTYRSRTPSPEKTNHQHSVKRPGQAGARRMGPPSTVSQNGRGQGKAKFELSKTQQRHTQNHETHKDAAQPLKQGTQKSVKPTARVESRRASPRGKLSSSAQMTVDTPPKSSVALREAIAKAKAAHRAALGSPSKLSPNAPKSNPDLPEIEIGGNNQLVMQKRIAAARMEGRLNISGMGLKGLPAGLQNMYETNTMLDDEASWAESVDLVKLVAADNEIDELEDRFFPNYDEDDDASILKGSNVLAGLETLDLHGNRLQDVPSRLEALHRLSNLNLSRNKLDGKVMGMIAHLTSLRELRLADNNITQIEQMKVQSLQQLEVLDLSRNGLVTLPTSLAILPRLHTLILSGNRLKDLPEEIATSSQLRELVVAHNSLKGCLLSTTGAELASLRILDVSYNGLSSISAQPHLELPSLQSLIISENRIKALPDIKSCSSLISFMADGNQLSETPPGITSLKVLKQMDLSRNDLRQVDNGVGSMESLTTVSIANNPIRERRLLNMNSEDLKQELQQRHAQECNDGDQLTAEFSRAPDEALTKEDRLFSGGNLDWSCLQLTNLDQSKLESVTQSNSIRSLNLTRNLLSDLPLSMGLLADTLTSLDLSSNKLGGKTYLEAHITLPKLKTLNLAANGLLSLSPLLTSLSAATLSELNITRNSLAELPVLRDRFTSLKIVHAADNRISVLPFQSVAGLEVLDVCSNEINYLDPKIGLLAQEGLRTLLVGANTFRVPRRDIVEKGTQAILTWLRGRIPDDQG